MLRRLVTNKKPLVIVTMVVALALAGLFLPAKKLSIEPFGMLSIESKITISIGYEVAYAASTIARYPGTATTAAEAPYSDVDWETPNNIFADNSAYAEHTGKAFDVGLYMYVLKATNYGFSIPSGATINGIVVEHERLKDANDGIADALVQLIKGGSRQGANRSAGAEWPTSETIETFGSSTDLWDLSWSDTDINASNFGVAVSCLGSVKDSEPKIDFLRLTVHYTPSPDITNAPTEINFGNVYTSTDYWAKGSAPVWSLEDDECTFTITNLTSVAVDIDIRSTHFTGGTPGWTLTSGIPGADTVRLKAGVSGDALETNMVILTTVDQDFILGLAASPSNTKMWELKMETPSSFSNADVKTATITLTATLSP